MHANIWLGTVHVQDLLVDVIFMILSMPNFLSSDVLLSKEGIFLYHAPTQL